MKAELSYSVVLPEVYGLATLRIVENCGFCALKT